MTSAKSRAAKKTSTRAAKASVAGEVPASDNTENEKASTASDRWRMLRLTTTVNAAFRVNQRELSQRRYESGSQCTSVKVK